MAGIRSLRRTCCTGDQGWRTPGKQIAPEVLPLLLQINRRLWNMPGSQDGFLGLRGGGGGRGVRPGAQMKARALLREQRSLPSTLEASEVI